MVAVTRSMTFLVFLIVGKMVVYASILEYS